MVNNLLHSTACEPNCQYQSFPNPTHTTIQIVVFIADVSQLWSVLFPDKNSIFHLISEQALLILFNTFSAPSAQDLYSLHSSLIFASCTRARSENSITPIINHIWTTTVNIVSKYAPSAGIRYDTPLARGYAMIAQHATYLPALPALPACLRHQSWQ